MIELYENIKSRRKELGLSQEELAHLVGYSGKSMISKVEKGDVDLSTTMIKKFSSALQTTPSELLGEPDYYFDESILLERVRPSNLAEQAGRVEKALELYQKYEKAIPEIQSAVEGLLKSPRSEQ